VAYIQISTIADRSEGTCIEPIQHVIRFKKSCNVPHCSTKSPEKG
jgi:hypothetical protein